MSLIKEQHAALHIARDLGLVALSLLCLPISLSVVLLAKTFKALSIVKEAERSPKLHNGREVKVLVTGVGMAKGLFLARSLYLGGCTVVGSDFEKHGIPVSGRYSKAISKFHSLRSPAGEGEFERYIEQVTSIIQSENIDLWVSCSGVATALEDARLMQKIEKGISCKTFQFNEDATFKLDNKYEFMTTTAGFGLQVPQWGFLSSSNDAESIAQSVKSQIDGATSVDFILKNVAMDDRTRGALPLISPARPKQMRDILENLDYKDSRWIMQQFIPGNEEYCTQALVVNGHVRAFLACPSASVLMHYELLDATSPLFQAMLRFTQTYATGMYAKYGQFSGHLSFDFLALSEPLVDGVKKQLLPIECNPRCHTAVVHFRGSEEALTSAYLSLLPSEKASDSSSVVPDAVIGGSKRAPLGYYWIAHDLVAVVILPLLRLIAGSGTVQSFIDSQLHFWRHVTLWKDPTLEWWDPLPWFVLNHIYWPGQLLMASWFGTRWSQINVSTGKMFIM